MPAEALKSPPTAARVLDVARPVAKTSQEQVLRAIFEQTGVKPGALIGAIAKLSYGPGKVSFNDFVRLRLFDREFLGGASPEAFVGQRRNMQITDAVNFQREWYGVLRNKVAAAGYLTDHGLPTIPIAAVYVAGLMTQRKSVLGDRQALEQFLLAKENYPLFGKPVLGLQSLGAIGLKNLDPARRELERMDGGVVRLDDLAAEIEASYGSGYVFQRLIAPHPAIAKLCGPRLATVRLVTMLTEDGPKIFRAAWKIPAGANTADNYWRGGNILAQLDADTGVAGRAMSGVGLGVAEHTQHPDTGAAIAGFAHPQWDAMRDLALNGAGLLRSVPLIGWDIACTPQGPVIVEMNESPDFGLIQLSERRGVLDDAFNAFVAFQKVEAARHHVEIKAQQQQLV
jgi:hypothetical protein